MALKSVRIVDLCGKSSGLADFENTVDRGSAVIFDADHDRTENALTVSTSRCPIQNFSKALDGTRGGTYSVRVFRPVMRIVPLGLWS